MKRIPLGMGVVALSVCGVVSNAAPQVVGTRAAVGVVGDANNDGVANALDLRVVQFNLGRSGGRAQGDFTGDGLVDSRDLSLLTQNYERRQPAAYFGKVADSTTAIPSASGAFATVINAPVVDKQGNLAFYGGGGGRLGIYRYSGGALTRVADNTTNVPGTTQAFEYFDTPSISSGKLVFGGIGVRNPQTGQVPQGIYTFDGLTLSTAVTTTTARPEGGNFQYFQFSNASLVNTSLSFVATASGGTIANAYRMAGSTLVPLADTNTPIPNGTGNFIALPDVASDGTTTFFVGRGLGQFGIYRKSGNTITTLLDKNTPVPGTSYKFMNSVGNLAVDGANFVFNGEFGLASQGVYAMVGSALKSVANTNTAIPDGGGRRFAAFGPASIGGNSVAFLGYDQVGTETIPGIYAWINGELIKVIDSSTTLNGKMIDDLSMTRSAVYGNKVTFQVEFTDHTKAVYVATLPRTYVPGDVNLDGSVNGKDLAVLRANMGKAGAGWAGGDLDQDGKVTFADFQLLERNFGRTGASLAGDIDGNGVVNTEDFKTLSANFGKYGGYTQGDLSLDGKIDFTDFQILERNMRKTGGAFAPFDTAAAAVASFDLADATVPEPAGVAVVAALGVLGLARRRRAR